MNIARLAVPLAVLLISGCVVAPVGRGRGPGVGVGVGVGVGIGISVPVLPLVVELGSDPYYSYGGYSYFYDNDHWRYAESRDGRWQDLPRSHYPRETRYRGRSDGHDGARGR